MRVCYPHGLSHLFPARATPAFSVSSHFSLGCCLLCDCQNHSRPHSLAFRYSYLYCNIWDLISALLFLVSFLSMSFVQIVSTLGRCPCLLLITCPFGALDTILDTEEIFRTYLLSSYVIEEVRTGVTVSSSAVVLGQPWIWMVQTSLL